MKKELKDCIHLYNNRFNPVKVLVDDSDVKYLWDIDVYSEDDYVNITLGETPMRSGDSNDWNVYNDNYLLSRIKPILRPLSDITDEESLESSKILGGASHLSDESQIYQAKELLCTNKIYNYQTNIPGISWIRLTRYLLSKHFDLFGLIEAGLALNKNDLK